MHPVHCNPPGSIGLCCWDHPWVGDYDPSDLIGECPQCGMSLGILKVSEAPEQDRKAAEWVIEHGDVELVDVTHPEVPHE